MTPEYLPFDPERAAGAEPLEEQRDAGARPLSVSQASALIRATLEEHVPADLRVIGQVSNLRAHNHWFFSLKDSQAVISCVAWASSVRRFEVRPAEGDEVVVSGYVSHYEPQGRTQLYVQTLEPVGAGALELRFRALCDELRRDGYFDDTHKVALPVFPRRVAVITSVASAAVRDVVETARQRCPAVALLLVDVRVQGEGAAEQVAAAIRRVDRDAAALGVEAILVTRGGGSVEDLWAFNERVVADAAYACRVPLVAAIGHESDTTVIELVADRRAATPTQAAMHLVPDASQLRQQIDHYAGRLGLLVRRSVDAARERTLTRHRELRRSVRTRAAGERLALERLAGRLERGLRQRVDRGAELAASRRRLEQAVRVHAARQDERLRGLGRQLESLDPLRVLQRGYSYTTTAEGRLVRSAGAVGPGDAIVTRLADGSIESIVRPRPAGRSGGSAPQMDLFGGA